MSYRERPKPPKRVRRTLQDTATENITFVQNGVTAKLAIPCWYLEVNHPQHTFVHDREWHDHVGWPDPQHPDASCQDASSIRLPFHYYDNLRGWVTSHRYIDMSKCYPIHLKAEGYDKIEIAFTKDIEGLQASGYIDDWIARITFFPQCPDAIEEDITVPYVVFASGEHTTSRDIIAKGVLRIVSGPYKELGA